MAISKKQQAEIDNRLERALTLAAFHRTEPVLPDVPVPTPFGTLSKGFLPSGYHDGISIQKACSSSVHHGIGYDDKTTTQGSRRLFSTKLLALKNARYDAEIYAAMILRRIDRQIEAEQKNQTT